MEIHFFFHSKCLFFEYFAYTQFFSIHHEIAFIGFAHTHIGRKKYIEKSVDASFSAVILFVSAKILCALLRNVFFTNNNTDPNVKRKHYIKKSLYEREELKSNLSNLRVIQRTPSEMWCSFRHHKESKSLDNTSTKTNNRYVSALKVDSQPTGPFAIIAINSSQ